MIDTHSHIYLEHFDTDRFEMLERAKAVGIKHIYMPNIDSSSIGAMLELEKKYPSLCTSMMGLHPTSVKENYKEELAVIREWLDKREFVAIGEIGMDLYWDKTFIKEQEEVFAQQLQWSVELDKPVVIHVREAFKETFEVIKKSYHPNLKGIFHSFTGTKEDAEFITSLPNFYLGINGVVTFKNSNLRDVLKSVGFDKLLLETDAPYLSPVPYRGKRNEPSYLTNIISVLSELFGVTNQKIIEVTTQNAIDIFKIDDNPTNIGIS